MVNLYPGELEIGEKVEIGRSMRALKEEPTTLNGSNEQSSPLNEDSGAVLPVFF